MELNKLLHFLPEALERTGLIIPRPAITLNEKEYRLVEVFALPPARGSQQQG